MRKLFVAGLLSLSAISYAQSNQGSWGLYNYDRDQYQKSYNTYEIRSVASITKLFTATTILRSGLDLEERVKVTGKSRGRFSKGMMVKRIDLMKAMLISSDNLAAETLANTYPGGFDQFITDTNQWVRGWGLVHTTIVDASGLLAGNQSNVSELTTLIYKIRQYPEILSISAEANAVLNIPKGRKEIAIHLKNTNPEIFSFDNIILSKTGTTNAAGKCVVMLVTKERQTYAVVILGQRNSKERSQIAQFLLKLTPFTSAMADEAPVEINLGL